MKNFILRRLFLAIPMAIAVSLISFSLLYFSPGNPAEIILEQKSPDSSPDENAIKEYEKKLGLDKPFYDLYVIWLSKALTGDFGVSLQNGEPVIDEFMARFPYTVMIMVGATTVYFVLGVVMGILSALNKDGIIDNIVRAYASLKMAIPSFWLALLLIWVFSVKLKIISAFGYNGLDSLILPSFALGLGMAGSLARVLRTCILEVMSSDYILTARAKGLSNKVVVLKHVLKNAFLPVITLMGMKTAYLLGGAVIIESIFGWPGIGSYFIDIINAKDYPAVSGLVFIFGILFVLVNLIVDISYAILDPRVRYDKGV
ncbi:ABC transporter permease [Methanococcus aeolicus]|uniref:Binding-protein-dependent transport systems inner membrane component n=1 Tax=Methanococcus aeolicus (strain ATCC BAA-1280 / DSM 17508 / OCM 812 / Nankai-3) TaxID=419665 RepID=A6UUC5_META3|nr:ABC transporter permease [Methanococcus aeolicus]ABR56097.1 binding-protein-dependent transport systems inner membrane component [Methanococcus aeolicus Nankai-3]UXM85300.1 ABC transporter permease [Methanococcus aeolicus]